MLGSQGALATIVTAESAGAHLVLLGTAGAGLYVAARPLRRRRPWSPAPEPAADEAA